MYGCTLLPGVDLGDTASFQTVVTLPVIVPRHAYPLYFALGKVFVGAFGENSPAYAMNLLSAAAGVAAIVACVWLIWALTGRAVAALWASLLFAASYTFWSQAVIAEVYTLEALFIALVLIAAVGWWRKPTGARLACLYAVYAVSFGNHLSMILFAPALVWLLWNGRTRALRLAEATSPPPAQGRPSGLAAIDPFSPKGIALAAAIAAAGALQYGWNFAGLWALTAPRRPPLEQVSTFWFDVTKSDWRATLVGTVPVAQWGDRVAMYWWDLRQQFGIAGVAIAVLGLFAVLRRSAALAIALLLAYAVTFAFAFIYNVGDTHVFLLPSHQIVAILAGAGAGALLGAAARLPRASYKIATIALFALPAWRIADTWPAVDRSNDRRAEQYAEAALAGVAPAASVYLGDLNWQTQNAVGYELAVKRPEIPRTFVSQVLWHFPEFVRRNQALGRDIILTRPAADAVAAAYGSLFPVRADTREHTLALSRVATVPSGTPYVLVIMTPLPELVYDPADVADTARALAGIPLPRARYVVVAGLSGSRPVLTRTGNHPYRVDATLAGHRFQIRLESWLPADTMRRAGFGHVIVDRRHALTLERGANLGVFDAAGHLRASANQGGSFAVQPRWVIPVLR